MNAGYARAAIRKGIAKLLTRADADRLSANVGQAWPTDFRG